MTQTTTSADGSTIAYAKSGMGPALIIIGGAFNTRQSAGDLARVLATHFSVFTYDRRGRGDSTETPPYSTQREVEDLAALVDAAGGSACVYGHSSGGILALEAAAAGLPITKVAAFEPPYTDPADGFGTLDDWRKSVQAAVNAGDREGASVVFLRGMGMDAEMAEGLTHAPWWPGMQAVAHTLPYELSLLGDGTVPVERFSRITVPTLLISGGDSPAWAAEAVSEIAAAIPDAKQVVVQGQDHNVDPATIAPELSDFFRA
jgi:pimeloyl-ACP methyl ester carboxylesterase